MMLSNNGEEYYSNRSCDQQLMTGSLWLPSSRVVLLIPQSDIPNCILTKSSKLNNSLTTNCSLSILYDILPTV